MTKRFIGTVKKGAINRIREIDNSEYEEIVKARKVLISLSRDQQLFMIVVANYDDYNEYLSTLLKEYKENQSIGWTGMEKIISEINRRMLNLLSAMRTFLDHSETNLKRCHGKESERCRRFKNACSESFDNVFSYRFIYNLRSYAQHCGMPVGHLGLHSEMIKPDYKDELHQISIQFDRDELLLNYDWKKTLKEEIQKLPNKFEVNEHLDGMMSCLYKINLVLIEDKLSEAIRCSEYLKRLILSIKDMAGIPCIMQMKKKDANNLDLELELEWLPLHIIELVSDSKIYQT